LRRRAAAGSGEPARAWSGSTSSASDGDIVGRPGSPGALFIDEDEAIELGLAWYASSAPERSDAREQNLTIPPVADRLRQSRRAMTGLVILTVGFVLQIVANWPT
jgi:hypothetical protein